MTRDKIKAMMERVLPVTCHAAIVGLNENPQLRLCGIKSGD